MTILSLPDRTLAYQQRCASPGSEGQPGILFLGGFASDMNGTKALFLDEKCGQTGLAYTRFDYRGHGGSSDRFEDGCIGDWADDALQIIDRVAQGPQIVVGSSMGGWIALLLTKKRPERVAAMIGLAAAPDFTEALIAPRLSPAQKEELAQNGKTYESDDIREPRVPITQKLLDDGPRHNVLHEPLTYTGPVRLFQGQKDLSVPWKHALKIAQTVTSEDLRLTLIKDADHRLSRPQDLALVWNEIERLTGRL